MHHRFRMRFQLTKLVAMLQGLRKIGLHDHSRIREFSVQHGGVGRAGKKGATIEAPKIVLGIRIRGRCAILVVRTQLIDSLSAAEGNYRCDSLNFLTWLASRGGPLV